LQSLIAAVQGVGAAIADRIGPIHIGAAERGLLETIYLLLTSIVCVPAVCKLIPGGSPVLGYLVSNPKRVTCYMNDIDATRVNCEHAC
jgi:hypothetical protein